MGNQYEINRKLGQAWGRWWEAWKRMGSWEKIGKLGIGCEARQRVESWGEAQSMIPA
jgi:hypothetical protein